MTRPEHILIGVCLAVACTPTRRLEERPLQSSERRTVEAPRPAEPAAPRREHHTDRAAPGPEPRAESDADVEPAPVPHAPGAVWAGRRPLLVHAQPDRHSEVRGRIPRDEPFVVFGTVTADDCGGDGWGAVASGGHVCLARARESDGATRSLPVVLPGETTPFYYARHERPGDMLPRWRNRTMLSRGAEPEELLEDRRIYAFVRRRPTRRHGPLLFDDRRRVVREDDADRLKPSTFAGVELGEVLAAGQLAWVIAWPGADVFETAGARNTATRRIPFHARVMVDGAGVPAGDTRRFALADGTGFVEEEDIRRHVLAPPPDGIGSAEPWVDVDVQQQTLTLYRGTQPEFATLVSTGGPKDPTPGGEFRVRLKQAYGKMESRDDADVRYHVEGVPWVLYFHKRYALHGAAWHNRFGRRTSHGCVNLAPVDAARVFAALGPRLPEGWVSVHAHEDDIGGRVRIRR